MDRKSNTLTLTPSIKKPSCFRRLSVFLGYIVEIQIYFTSVTHERCRYVNTKPFLVWPSLLAVETTSTVVTVMVELAY